MYWVPLGSFNKGFIASFRGRVSSGSGFDELDAAFDIIAGSNVYISCIGGDVQCILESDTDDARQHRNIECGTLSLITAEENRQMQHTMHVSHVQDDCVWILMLLLVRMNGASNGVWTTPARRLQQKN